MANPLHANVGLSDDLLLGFVGWYTITQPQITHEELAKLVTELNLSPSIIPNPPRGGDAFKRACRYSERNGIRIPSTGHVANFLIRKVAQNAQEIERHLVLEIVDARGRTLEHRDVAHLRYERVGDAGRLHVKKEVDTNPDIALMIEETLSMFMQNLKDATRFIEAQVIRRMVRDQLDLISAIAMRRQGSVYFVPKHHADKVEALEMFCQSMGPGSEFFAVPVPDASKYREFIVEAFESELHDEATKLIADMERILHSKTQITSRVFAETRDRLRVLQERSEEYGDLVSHQAFKAQVELKALSQKLGKIMTEGLVK